MSAALRHGSSWGHLNGANVQRPFFTEVEQVGVHVLEDQVEAGALPENVKQAASAIARRGQSSGSSASEGGGEIDCSGTCGSPCICTDLAKDFRDDEVNDSLSEDSSDRKKMSVEVMNSSAEQ